MKNFILDQKIVLCRLKITPIQLLLSRKHISFKTHLQQKRLSQNRLPQILILLMAAFFGYSVCFTFIVDEVILQKHKYDLKASLSQNLSDEALFSFLKPFDFEEDEFESNGKMYDVVRTKKTPDGLQVFCVEDNEETILNLELNAKINAILEHQTNKNEPAKRIFEFLKKQYQILELSAFHSYFIEITKITYPQVINFCPTYPHFCFSPPPEV